jgi:hypothetical protein
VRPLLSLRWSGSRTLVSTTTMRRPIPWLTASLIALIISAAYFRVRPHNRFFTPAPPMGGEPGLMLWAWEIPEDLRSLDVSRTGVAYLSRELLLGSNKEVRPRHQRLLLPANVFLMPVVRIETTPAFRWSDAEIPIIATQIVEAAREPHTRALQVDFDARASERPFYAALLRDLRRQLPPETSLSITALTSWCGRGSWLHGLPIDEAVPMFFRMGGPRIMRITAPRNFSDIEEPLCTGSVGVATDERWPQVDGRQRVYVFRVGSWRAEDLASVNMGRYGQLQSLSTPSNQGPQR